MEVGPEAGVPTPAASPALSPLLPYWAAWPQGPGFLEAPIQGAARARLLHGEGPDGPVGWASEAAARQSHEAVWGQGQAATWPLPPSAAQAGPVAGGGPARLTVDQVLGVEVEGDGDGRPEAGEAWHLAFRVRHDSGGGSGWRRAHLAFASPDLGATGFALIPPLGPDKGPRWALPPHPDQAAYRCTLRLGAVPPPWPWVAELVVADEQGATEAWPLAFDRQEAEAP